MIIRNVKSLKRLHLAHLLYTIFGIFSVIITLHLYDCPSRLQPILCHAELVQCEHLVMYDDREEEGRKVQLLYADRMVQLLQRLGLESIATCKAIHCPHAFCLSFTTKAGFKLAYSGDTRPNPAFRELGMMGGRGPDLLIHEATMEHFMINDARIKKHSTMTEAVEEGEGMKAEFTLLTHFSQR